MQPPFLCPGSFWVNSCLQKILGLCIPQPRAFSETTIYTGSVRRKVTAPYVQSDVDSILRPALCRPLDLYRDLEVFVVCCMVCSCVGADLGTLPSFI